METRANYVAVGAFVLIIFMSFIVAALWFARVQFKQEYVHYVTYFSGISGLNRQATVRVNGIDVGRVVDLTLDPADNRNVVVRFDIRSDITLHEGAVTSLGSGGFTGQSYLLVEDGPPQAGPIAERTPQGELIIKSRPSTLERIEEAAPEIAAQASVVTARLAALLDDKNRAAIGAILANLRDSSAVLSQRRADIDHIITDTARATHTLSDTLENLNKTAIDLRGMLAKASNVPERLDTMLVSLNDTTRKLGTLSGDLDETVREDRPQIRQFAGNGLTQLTELSGEMRTLVVSLTHLSQQLDRDPNMVIFGDRRTGYSPR